MPISVQQFDFIAASQGIAVALRVAEEAGGVTGTRDVATQIELGTGGVSGLSGTTLSGQGGQFMPGTAITDLSQAIGAAGTATSGGILGGGGLAGDVFSPGGRNIQDILAMYAGDQPADLPNAPFTAPPVADPTMVHAYYPDGRYHGLMSAADAAFLNLVIGEAPTAAAAPAAVSGDQQILDAVMAGTIIETSRLAEIGDLGIRTQAANQLAKLLVSGLGNTQAAVQELGKIYTQFISGEGALNFNDWTTGAGLDWAQVPEPVTTVPTTDVTDITVVYFSDGTVQDVPTDEVEAFLAANEGTTTDPNRYPVGEFGAEQRARTVGAQGLQGTDKEIYDFLTGLYKKQIDTNSSTPAVAMLSEAADTMLGKPGMFGQTFTDFASAHAFLTDWTQNPLKGNLGTADGWNAFSDAAMAMPQWSPTTTFPPTTYAGAPGTTGGFDMGGLGPYGTWESLRPFSQIYPGFTSLLPGYGGSRAVQSAYAQAAAPLEMQYLAQQALTPAGAPGVGAVGSDVKNWLQNVQAGTQPLMMGQDYGSFLNQLAGVLGSPMGARPTGMNPNVFSKMAGLFQDPAAQLEAFKNPFYRATAGSPQVRSALMDQIQQAAQRYQYQEPSGAFLPWAMEQNLAGIQGILPSLKGWVPPV